jgi:hypothetical protein
MWQQRKLRKLFSHLQNIFHLLTSKSKDKIAEPPLRANKTSTISDILQQHTPINDNYTAVSPEDKGQRHAFFKKNCLQTTFL